MPDLDAAVHEFQHQLDVAGLRPEENICAAGQFFWADRIRLALAPKIDLLMAPGSPAQPFVSFARSLLEPLRLRQPSVPRQVDELESMARRLPVSATVRAQMLALTAAARATAEGLSYDLWTKLNENRSNTLPALDDRDVSFRTAWLLSQDEKLASWTHVHLAAQRLRHRGRRWKHPNGRMNKSLIGGSPPWGKSSRVLASDRRYLGDVIYQRTVATVVARMRTALDEGQMLHARVLTGGSYGTARPTPLTLDGLNQIMDPRPPEEHSLLIFGHDGADTFVFHDADAGASHSPEDGFGLLFHDPTRGALGTAATSSDLRVTADGRHARGDKRYQVLRVFSI